MIEKSCKISLTTKSRPFWTLSAPLVSWEILRYGLVSSHLWIREKLARISCFVSESEKYCNISQDFLMYSAGPDRVYESRMAQKPALLADWPITVRHLSATDPAIWLSRSAKLAPDPFIGQLTGYLIERFREEVCDCQVCWYVNTAENIWHCVQEVLFLFSHILLSKIYQYIW